MRIKVFDRILAVLLSLLVIAAVAVFLIVALDVMSIKDVYMSVLELMPTIETAKLIYGGISILVLIIAIRVIVAVSSGKTVEHLPTAVHLDTSDLGSTYVSLAAIDAMVQRHCRSIPRIRECSTVVTPFNDGVKVAVKLVLTNEANIPELTAGLQKSLKSYVEELSGVKLLDIGILIVSAPAPQKTQM